MGKWIAKFIIMFIGLIYFGEKWFIYIILNNGHTYPTCYRKDVDNDTRFRTM